MDLLRVLIIQAPGWLFWTWVCQLLTCHVVWMVVDMVWDYCKGFPVRGCGYLLDSVGNLTGFGNASETWKNSENVCWKIEGSAIWGYFLAVFALCLNLIQRGFIAVLA